MKKLKKLDQAFSRYIRLRDSVDGICKCFTCGLLRPWKGMDCGHGVPRQHLATRYNEQNNHAQCKRCNGFEGGRMDVYAKEVDMRYGEGTWDKLLLQSKGTHKIDQFTIDTMTKHYKQLADEYEN